MSDELDDPGVPPLTVYGSTQSFFTRKVTGYLDYKQLPWHLRRGLAPSAEARAGGWPGGIPAVIDAEGRVMWDSTSLILHFEHHRPERSVLPTDPTHRFLCFVLDDFNDEWFYRLAVGSRWYYPENTTHGSWDLAREGAFEIPAPVDQIRQMVTATMTGSLPPLGATPDNIDALMDESLKPWLRAFSAHLSADGYLFGGRPSMADFAFYGGDAAHFVNDPLCWRWVEEEGPEVAKHTFRLTEPDDQEFGDWLAPGEDAGIASNLRKIGLKAGLSGEALDACMKDNDMAKAMVATFQTNAKKDDINSTPSFVIDGQKYANMSYEEFAKTLDEKLAN